MVIQVVTSLACIGVFLFSIDLDYRTSFRILCSPTYFLIHIVEKKSLPLVVWVNCPSPNQNYLILLLNKGTRDPKWLENSLKFQFSGIIVVVPGVSILFSRTKNSRAVENMVVETGSKNFTTGSLVEIVNDASPISTPSFLES